MKNVIDQTIDLLRAYVDKVYDGNQTKAAEGMGISYGVLRKWLLGERVPSLTSMAPIFQAMGVSLGEPNKTTWEYAYIPRVHRNIGGGFGPGGLDEVDKRMPVDPAFLQEHKLAPESLLITGIENSSMRPTFKPGDLMLIDRSDTQMQEGCYYLIEIQDQWIARRVEMNVEGLKLIADNVAYGSMQVRPETLAQLKVIGRIVWCWKQM